MSAPAEATSKPIDFRALFTTKNTQSVLSSFLPRINSYKTDTEFEKDRNELIERIIKSFISSPNTWDEACQTNIQWFGDKFISDISGAHSLQTKEDIDLIFSSCYRFLCELDLSMKNDLPLEFQEISDFAEKNFEQFSSQAKRQIQFAQKGMLIGIMKKIYSSDAVKSILRVQTFNTEVEEKLTRWKNQLIEKEQKVERLSKALERHETAYNFVGLYAGFEELMKEKQKEKKAYAWWTIILGGTIAAILAAKTICILAYPPDARDPLTYLICASVLALIAALIYFFRVALLNFKSVKSQILQIQLRQTLCRFIQSYIEYKQNEEKIEKETLSMFEKLIFSNIVADEGQIPSTFDSLDHLASIAKAIKS